MSDRPKKPTQAEAQEALRRALGGGARIEFAPGHRVHAFPDVAERLWSAVGVRPRFVSHESTLWDFFVGLTPEEHGDVLRAIEGEFGVAVEAYHLDQPLWMLLERLAGAKPH
jgi:hypothetical protein